MGRLREVDLKDLDITHGRICFGKALSYAAKMKLEEAVTCFLEDIKICNKYKDVQGEMKSYAQLGYTYLKKGSRYLQQV